MGPKFMLNIKKFKNFKGFNFLYVVLTSNGNATKANESFDNGVFFDIEAKRTRATVSKLFRMYNYPLHTIK